MACWRCGCRRRGREWGVPYSLSPYSLLSQSANHEIAERRRGGVPFGAGQQAVTCIGRRSGAGDDAHDLIIDPQFDALAFEPRAETGAFGEAERSFGEDGALVAVAFIATELAAGRIDDKAEVALRAVEAQDQSAPIPDDACVHFDHHIGPDRRGAEGPNVAEAGVGLNAIDAIARTDAPAVAAGCGPVAVGAKVGLIDDRPAGSDRCG